MELDPGHFKAVYNRAFSYDKVRFSPVMEAPLPHSHATPRLVPRQMGRLEAAVVDYTRAIELEPRNANAYHNRGSTSDKVCVCVFLVLACLSHPILLTTLSARPS